VALPLQLGCKLPSRIGHGFAILQPSTLPLTTRTAPPSQHPAPRAHRRGGGAVHARPLPCRGSQLAVGGVAATNSIKRPKTKERNRRPTSPFPGHHDRYLALLVRFAGGWGREGMGEAEDSKGSRGQVPPWRAFREAVPIRAANLRSRTLRGPLLPSPADIVAGSWTASASTAAASADGREARMNPQTVWL